MPEPANNAISICNSEISPSNPSAANSIKDVYSLYAKIKYIIAVARITAARRIYYNML